MKTKKIDVDEWFNGGEIKNQKVEPVMPEVTSLEVKKEVKKFTSKEVSEESNIKVNFEETKEIEKLVKFGTYLPPSLIKKIKVDAAISDRDQQDIIRDILERHYKKRFN